MQYLFEHKLHLARFWSEYGQLPYGRRGTSKKSKEQTLRALQKLGEIKLNPSPQARSAKTNRRQYEKYKKHLKGYNGFTLCFACRAPATVRHHIIWIMNGGRNHKKNVLALCRPCHAEIHPWLR